ncbi:MAG: diguanylate cyclase domain-containing protein, partial [Acidiferrobacterales bacterium]
MAIAADDEALPTTPLQAELRRLLEAMEPLEELESKCDDLKEQLTDELPASRLGDVLEATIDLLIEALDQQKKEHEHWKTFVCRLNDRLCELNKSMQNTEQQMLSSYYGGRKVEAELERHVDDIATKLHSATSVEQLKAHVHQRVSVIRARLKDSQGKAAQQFTDLQAQLNKLSASIQQLERESAELRGRHEQGQPLIDPLTGIANRFAFEERLQEEIARSKRYGSPLVAQLWQVDDFESLRRGFGRKVGKKALQLIAQILGTQLRQTDYIAHYENETF